MMFSYFKTNKSLRLELALEKENSARLTLSIQRQRTRLTALYAEREVLLKKVDHAANNAKIHEALALAEQESKYKAARIVQGVKKPSASPVAPTLRPRYSPPTSTAPSPATTSPPPDNNYWTGVLTGVVVNEIFSSPSPAPAAPYSSGGGGDYGGGGASGSWDSGSSSSSSDSSSSSSSD